MIEEYLVQKPCSFLPTGVQNPTQIIMNVTPVNSPPTPVRQVQVCLNDSIPNGTGLEFSTYAKVFVQNSLFQSVKSHVSDNDCTCYVRYNSQSATGPDPIDSFELIANH